MSAPNFEILAVCGDILPSQVLPGHYDLYGFPLRHIVIDQENPEVKLGFCVFIMLQGASEVKEEKLTISIENSDGEVIDSKDSTTAPVEKLQTQTFFTPFYIPAVADRYAIIATCGESAEATSIVVSVGETDDVDEAATVEAPDPV